MQHAAELNAVPLTLESIAGLARLSANQGNAAQAIAWIGLIADKRGMNPDIKSIIDPLLAELSAKLPPDAVQLILRRVKR